MPASVHGAFTLRALGALSRLHLPGRADGALLDLLRLMSLSSDTEPQHHETWCRSVRVDPARVATVEVGSISGLCRLMGRVYGSGSCATKIAKRHLAIWTEHRLAALRGGVIFLFTPHIIALDPHARRDEREAPPVEWRWQKRSSKTLLTALVASRLAGPQTAFTFGVPEPDPQGIDPQGIGTPLYRDLDDVGEGGACASRAGEELEDLARLAESAAQPLPDGRPFRLSPSARRRLGWIVDTHGPDAVRSALLEDAPRYAITHPLAWLDTVLTGPAPEGVEPDSPPSPDVPAPVLEAVQASLPPGRNGAPRALSKTEILTLAGLVERHGADAVITSAADVGGYRLPVQGIAARLDRKRPAQAAPRAMGRRDAAEQRRRAAIEIGRHRGPTRLESDEERAQRDAEAKRVWREAEAALAQREAEAEGERERRDVERRRQAEAEQARREAERPVIAAKFGRFLGIRRVGGAA